MIEITTFNDLSMSITEKEEVPLGVFWSGDWQVPEDDVFAQTTGRDRLELLAKSTYSTNQTKENVSLYELGEDILKDCGLSESEYYIDEELQSIVIPYGYLEPVSHREALRLIAEASLEQCYCDREGKIRLEGFSHLASKEEEDIEITADNYFKKDNPNNFTQIANYIELQTQPLRPDELQEVYRSNEPESIGAGETTEQTISYNDSPCIDAVATIEGAGTIDDVEYYNWGAKVTISSSTTGTFELVINAKPLKLSGRQKVFAKDDNSIRDNGLIKFSFPNNYLVQSRSIGQQIVDNLLGYYKDPRRDLILDWRGNPALLLGSRMKVVDEYEGTDFFLTKQTIDYDGALRVNAEGRKA